MQFREQLWTYALVTGVAVLIWLWAAMETRDEASASFRIELVPAANQVVEPSQLTVQVQMDGSKLALQNAHQLASREEPLRLTVGTELPSVSGEHGLAAALQKSETLTDSGVSIVSVTPAMIKLLIDELVEVTLPVQVVLPGIETEGEPEVDPATALVKMPQRLLNGASSDLAIEAQVLQPRLDRLKPGVVNTVSATLSLPGRLAGESSVTIRPSNATIKFTVRSRIKEMTLSTVRVQIAGPPKDHDEYGIEIENPTLTDVTIKADAQLIAELQRHTAVVVAMVHLSQREKETGIESKPVTCFMALPLGENSTVKARIIDAEVDGSPQLPVIRLRITERKTGSAG